MRRFPSEPLNLVDQIDDGIVLLRTFPERSLNYIVTLGALMPRPVIVEETIPARIVAFPLLRHETSAEREEHLAEHLTPYEGALRDQMLLCDGFLSDGTPICDNPDYSILVPGYAGNPKRPA